MKLKSFLIIFLILGFFMAAAVRPALADFSAEVSVVSEFDAATSGMKVTSDSTYRPIDATGAILEGNKYNAAISDETRTIAVKISPAYSLSRGKMKYNDVMVEFYTDVVVAGDHSLQLLFPYTPAILSGATRSECKFVVPDINDTYDWARIIVRDEYGNNAVYAWVQFDGTAPAAPTMTPDIDADWGTVTSLSFYKSFYLHMNSGVATENIYAWWVDSNNKKIGSLDADIAENMLNPVIGLQVDIIDSLNSDFEIRYTDRGSNGTLSDTDHWTGSYEAITATNPDFDDTLDSVNRKNVMTYYDETAAGSEYSILLPAAAPVEYAHLHFYYKGVELTADPSTDKSIDSYNYKKFVVHDAILNAADASADWSCNNDKVLVQFNDGPSNLSYAGARDGVGPYLVNAYVDFDNKKKVKLEFSEDLLKSKITSSTKSEIKLWNTTGNFEISIQSVAVDPDNANILILTTTTNVEEDQKATVNFKAVTTPTIMDANENVRTQLNTPVKVAIERKISKVWTVNVDVSGTTPVTHIEVYFDKAMTEATIEDTTAYYVEVVPGLEEAADPNDGANILGVVYSEAPNADGDMEYKAIIEVEGQVESTAAADLPEVKVVGEDVAGSSGGPIRSADFNKFFASEDHVGPYLISAYYNMNPIQGKTVKELIEDYQSHTLSLVFSEEVKTEYKIDETSFDGHGTFTANDALRRMSFSDCVKDPNDRWVVTGTIDDSVSENQAIFQAPAFAGPKVIYIPAAAIDDFQDALENSASFSGTASEVAVTDETPVWVKSAKTYDTNDNGIVDQVIVEFGKNASLNLNDIEDAKALKFNGDPNVIDYATTNVAGNTLTIDLDEQDGLGNDRPQDTGMTPTITLELTDTIYVEDLTKADSYLTDPISVDAEDNAHPVIINWVDDTNTVITPDGTSDMYAQKKSAKLYMVTLLFSEKMDPAIYENPEDAYSYFYKPGTSDADPNVITFLTATSTPPAPTAELSCGGNRIVILVNNKKELGYEANGQMRVGIKVRTGRMEDLNELALNAGKLEFDLIPKPNVDVYTPPDVFGTHTPFQSAVAMTLTGNIIDPNGREALAGTRIYAFHRDELFDTDPNTNGSDDYDLQGKVGFDFRPWKCYGSATIQNDVDNDPNGYAMKIYGKMFADDADAKGFVDGEPVILVVDRKLKNAHYVSEDATNDVEIASTACLGNTAYSVVFEARKKKVFNIDLRKREEIKLQPGWNFVSTSIATSYYNNAQTTMKGIDPDSFTGYIYQPGDPLTAEKGSLPSSACMMNDITDVLFTISNAGFAKTLIYDISDPIDAVVDELGDKFNKTTSFIPGRGYYIYVQENAKQWKNWRIVLFGDKIPSADCKLKAHGGTNLIGHWGGEIYLTGNAPSDITGVRAASSLNTEENEVYIDNIALPMNAAITAPTSFALNITDVDGNDVQASIVSTYYNYGGTDPITYVADWFADEEPEFSNLTFMAPGGGYYLIVNGASANETVFINYYSLEE